MLRICITTILLPFMALSCIEDKGNYTYTTLDQIMPVTIAELDAKYTVYQGDVLRIEPAFTAIDDEQKYEYKWYAVAENGEKTVLATQKTLDDIIALPQAEYTLYFQVRDADLDIWKAVKSTLSVTAAIQNGWYMLKDNGGRTDFDYFGLDGLVVEDVMENVVDGGPLGGEPLRMQYQPKDYYTEVVNDQGNVEILKNQKAIHIASTEEFKTIGAEKFRLFKTYEDQFYSDEYAVKPYAVSYFNSYVFYVDNGSLFSIGVGGVGKFGVPYYYGDFIYDYDIFPSFIHMGKTVVVYDRKSCTFFAATHQTGANAMLMQRFAEDTSAPSPTNINMDMLGFFCPPEAINWQYSGYALLRDRSTGTHYIYTLETLGYLSYPPIVDINTVPQNAEILRANAFGTHLSARCLYFSPDNRLMLYELSDAEQRESVLKTFSGEEQIAFIHNQKAVIPGGEKAINTLVVATNSTDGWRTYFFEMINETPEINPEPKVVLQGKGKVKQVMYYNSGK